MCVALTSFTDQSNGDELTFHKGDVITLDPFEYQNTGDEEWYQGTYQNSTGVFPRNFVRISTIAVGDSKKNKSKNHSKKRTKKINFTTPSSAVPVNATNATNANNANNANNVTIDDANSMQHNLAGDTFDASQDETITGAKSILARLQQEMFDFERDVVDKDSEEQHLIIESKRLSMERHRLEEMEGRAGEEAIARLEAVEEERAYLRERMMEQRIKLQEEEEKYVNELKTVEEERRKVQERAMELENEDDDREDERELLELAREEVALEEERLAFKKEQREQEYVQLNQTRQKLEQEALQFQTEKQTHERSVQQLEDERRKAEAYVQTNIKVVQVALVVIIVILFLCTNLMMLFSISTTLYFSISTTLYCLYLFFFLYFFFYSFFFISF